VSAPWSTPESLGSVVNGVSNDMLAALSSDGETLVFTSDRPEGFGGGDLYVTTRSRR
jgi:Tol biopolymer transport system component